MEEEQKHTEQPQVHEPQVYGWVGEFVILKYMSGPSINWDNPKQVVKGQIEARTGIFYLQEVGPLGVVVVGTDENVSELGKEGNAPGAFIPWGSILVVVGPPEEGTARTDEELTDTGNS